MSLFKKKSLVLSHDQVYALNVLVERHGYNGKGFWISRPKGLGGDRVEVRFFDENKKEQVRYIDRYGAGI